MEQVTSEVVVAVVVVRIPANTQNQIDVFSLYPCGIFWSLSSELAFRLSFCTHIFLRTRYRHCEYQSFRYVHVLPDTQHVGPVQLFPPHCSHLAEQLEAEVVVVDGFVVVEVAPDVVVVIPPPPEVSLTVSTALAGTLTVTVPPDSVTDVWATA